MVEVIYSIDCHYPAAPNTNKINGNELSKKNKSLKE